ALICPVMERQGSRMMLRFQAWFAGPRAVGHQESPHTVLLGPKMMMISVLLEISVRWLVVIQLAVSRRAACRLVL
ncbi:hypothetical protein NDU88_001477, partial [Pleurodeles waltl]